jgi:hypothetical protein
MLSSAYLARSEHLLLVKNETTRILEHAEIQSTTSEIPCYLGGKQSKDGEPVEQSCHCALDDSFIDYRRSSGVIVSAA